MIKNYMNVILKIFPNIASGRKNFKYFESRIKKNLALTRKYIGKSKKLSSK